MLKKNILMNSILMKLVIYLTPILIVPLLIGLIGHMSLKEKIHIS